MRGLLRHATQMGVSVHGAYLDEGVLGQWFEGTREVYFDLRLTPDEQHFTVAHELGHAHHQHRCDGDQRAEDEADEYAARLLIDPTEYARLEREGIHPHDIADHFGVPEHALNLWKASCLVRLGSATYVRSKMGAERWAHREVVA